MVMEKQGLEWLSSRVRKLKLSDVGDQALVQLFRYGLLGLVLNAIGYSVYLLITFLGGTPKITMTVLYGIGATLSFLGNRKLTFSHEGKLVNAGARFVVAHIFGYFINYFILLVAVDIYGLSHQWVQASAIFIVAIFLFIMFRYYVFPSKSVLDAAKCM